VSVKIGGLLTELVVPEAAALSSAGAARAAAPGRVCLLAGQSIEFSGWLDALPLGYWARFTTVETVRLQVTSSAPLDVTVRVSDGRGICRDIASGPTREGTYEARVETGASADGGWAWPVLTAGTEDAEVTWAWATDDIVPTPSSLAVAITTFNRPQVCLRQLATLAAAARAGGSLDGVLGRVVLVDQGSSPVTESAGFAAVRDCLGERLTVIRQQNLGGSGGFTRGLHEGLKDPCITHVALLDDEGLAQPQGLAYAWAFAHAARRPTLVGGHMFDAASPTTLYGLGEVLDRRGFTRAWLPGTPRNADLAHTAVCDPRWLGPARTVDFQPWWMCLVPRATVEAIGLPMPFFLKWDDVEFGLRAQAAGFASVVLPGAVVWHAPWAGTGAESGWQGYFLLRNRIVTALLHDARPAGLAAGWMAETLGHLARHQPVAAAMGWAALRDVLAGPGWLHRDLQTAPERAAETARREIVAPHPVSAIAGSLTASARLLRRWSDLGRQYRAALPAVTSARRWEQTFTAAGVIARAHPTWSIVVTSFHSLDMLTKHWAGLIEAGELLGVSSGDVEVIVVDNADEPEVEEFARRQGFRYLPMGANVGLSAANNRGAELATGDYLLFANPDLGVKVADLPILSAEIDRTGGIVAPRVDFTNGTPQSAARGGPYLLAKLAHRGLAPKAALERYLWPVGPYESGAVVWCAGGATSLSRSVFDRIGGWPEEYFLYMEDVELGVRAGHLGIPVSVTASLRWVHEWGGDSRQGRLNKGMLLHLRSAVRFYTRHPKYLGLPR
jgi:galactofuranosylgalactofuranosylrhamnosyl-N-acetylglucosaminyl-diphospho-decaprenol beta-1,5/1,6-galactofuranosyltransferase